MLVFGDSRRAFEAYSRSAPGGVRKIALVDTFTDEKNEAVIAAEAIPDLYAVRLDTPRSRRGSFPSIVSEVRWELDTRGYSNVRILVSGGIKEDDIQALVTAGVDGFGIGTAISNAPVVDYALDIVEVGGKKYAKRGKYAGAKGVYRCPRCMNFDVLHEGHNAGKCPDCGVVQVDMMEVVLRNGKRTGGEEKPDAVRQRLLGELRAVQDI